MWLYQGRELTEMPPDVVGFVYIITNTVTGRQYIGKKNIKSTRRVKVKGRVNRKRVVSESDWVNYFGSNSVLLSEIQAGQAHLFKREILHFCTSKGEMALLEAKEQINREVLYHPDKYYNNFIGCKIHGKHLKR